MNRTFWRVSRGLLLFCLRSFVKVLRPLLSLGKTIFFRESLLECDFVLKLVLRRLEIIRGHLRKLLRVETLNGSIGVKRLVWGILLLIETIWLLIHGKRLVLTNLGLILGEYLLIRVYCFELSISVTMGLGSDHFCEIWSYLLRRYPVLFVDLLVFL